jgi:hypothetical protein
MNEFTTVTQQDLDDLDAGAVELTPRRRGKTEVEQTAAAPSVEAEMPQEAEVEAEATEAPTPKSPYIATPEEAGWTDLDKPKEKTEQGLRREAWTAHMTAEERDRQITALAQELLQGLRPHFEVCDGRLAVRGKSLLTGKLLCGVYDAEHFADLVAALGNLSVDQAYIWWATLNPFSDKVETTNALDRGFGVTKPQITRACWFVVDFDPDRPQIIEYGGKPKKTEATAEERERGRVVMEEVRAFLTTAWNFPEPWIVMSGNGYQMKYRVDLPATPETELLLKYILFILDKLYPVATTGVEIDTKMWDLPRICKIAGTYSRKGMPTEDRPRMLAYTVSCPETLEVIPEEVLQAFVDAHPELLAVELAAEKERQEREYTAMKAQARTGKGYLTVEEAHARVQDFCRRISALYSTDTSDGVTYYRLDRCLFLEASKEGQAKAVKAHNDPVSFICVWDRKNAIGKPGKIGAGCKTPWCGKVMDSVPYPHWELLKRLADPEYAARAGRVGCQDRSLGASGRATRNAVREPCRHAQERPGREHWDRPRRALPG